MNRRTFLKRTITVALGAWLLGMIPFEKIANTLFEANAASDTEPDVIIIGAGVAGLSAAYTLKQNGMKPLVLEARNRIGGRIWTDKQSFDKPLDLGATWIHGVTNNPITKLAKQQNIQILHVEEQDVVYNKLGKKMTEDHLDALEKKYDDLLEEVADIAEAESDNPTFSLQKAFDQVFRNHGFTKQELLELNLMVHTNIEHEYAADLADLSPKLWNDDGEFGGVDAIFLKGYDQITSFLAKGLSIKTETIVREISLGEQVTVTTNRGVFTADHVIVTVPLGVLKKGSIKFSPALPARKQQAISQLGMGVLDKVYMQFPSVFWDKNADWMHYMAADRGSLPEFYNIYKYTKQPILLGFNAGSFAKKAEKLADKEVVLQMMSTLKVMFGNKIPNPVRTKITRWSSDPYAYGSYSYNAVLTNADDRDALAEPVGEQLFFAGEATSADYFATVHGAYLTGIREAKRIIEIL